MTTTIDPSQFHQVFFEESLEGLEAMEQGLITLVPGDASAEDVNALFRVAHTLKGGSATFGFGDIAAFSHRVEDLLDEVREGQRSLDTPVVQLLLDCGDALRDMVFAARDGGDVDPDRIARLVSRVEEVGRLGDDTGGVVPAKPEADEGANDCAPAEPHPSSETAASDPVRQDSPSGWWIDFRPAPGILAQGNDVVLMFRELAELGPIVVEADCSGLPLLAELDPATCALSWRVRLDAAAPEEAIREVFEWVEDECELRLEPITAGPEPEPEDDDEAAVPVGPTSPPQGQAAPQVQPWAHTLSPPRGGASIRVATRKVDQLMDLVGELVITQSMLGTLTSTLTGPDAERLRAGLDQLDRQTRELQETVMQIRMLPISFIFNRFPRMIHDMSATLGKQVALEIQGESTEIDKNIMETIGDPLMHLMRNAVDHGLETPEQRRAAGKPAEGQVRLSAYHRGGSIYVEIADDGAGIQADRILAHARQQGLLSADEQPTVEQLHELLFRPGFSTSAQVSDLSGRGVGLDVVARGLRKLGGSVSIVSEPGVGTCFTIRLPLTLAVLDGQLVRCDGSIYIIPLDAMIETLALDPTALGRAPGGWELYPFRDGYISVRQLGQLLGQPPIQPPMSGNGPPRPLLMVLEMDGHRCGLVVDELLHQQQVVIKSLEANLWKVEGIAAATILGDGTVGLILDVASLVGLARTRQTANGSDESTQPSPTPSSPTQPSPNHSSPTHSLPMRRPM